MLCATKVFILNVSMMKIDIYVKILYIVNCAFCENMYHSIIRGFTSPIIIKTETAESIKINNIVPKRNQILY